MIHLNTPPASLPYSASYHAVDRIRERHGIEVSQTDMAEVVLCIINTIDDSERSALLTSRNPDNGRETWLVSLRGRQFRVVYDPQMACIVTVLP